MQAMRIFPEYPQRHTPQQLRRIAAHGPVWADEQRATSAQLATARSMLLRLPSAIALPPDFNLSIMLLSIADSGTGSASVEELLESDTCDTELDDHIATITSTEDGGHLSFPAPELRHDSTVTTRSSAPDSTMPAGLVVWGGVDTGRHTGGHMPGNSALPQGAMDRAHAWQPLGTSVEGQQVTEAAMRALVAAHAAASPGVVEAWYADMAAEDVAAMSAAAFECGWGMPDMPQAAREAASLLRATSNAWPWQPGASSERYPAGMAQGGVAQWGGNMNSPAWPDW